jgi:hypothetical protein
MRAKEAFAIELDQMTWGIGYPDFSFPSDLCRISIHLTSWGRCSYKYRPALAPQTTALSSWCRLSFTCRLLFPLPRLGCHACRLFDSSGQVNVVDERQKIENLSIAGNCEMWLSRSAESCDNRRHADEVVQVVKAPARGQSVRDFQPRRRAAQG